MGLNKNKKELFNSGLSLALCSALFIGSTLAYFTKSVHSEGNIIAAGNLDIGFKYKDDANNWKNLNKSIFTDINKISANEKIEKEIQIINTGNLPFNYDINIFRELEELALNSNLENILSVKIDRIQGEHIIEVYNNSLSNTLAEGNIELEKMSLLNKNDSHEYRITISMTDIDKPLDADQYSGMQIDPFDIQIRATQIYAPGAGSNIEIDKTDNGYQVITIKDEESMEKVVKDILTESPKAVIESSREENDYMVYVVRIPKAVTTNLFTPEDTENYDYIVVKVPKEVNGGKLEGKNEWINYDDEIKNPIETEKDPNAMYIPALDGIGYFYRSSSNGNIHVSVRTAVDLNFNEDDDIKIEYLNSKGNVMKAATKSKLYSEYLNKDGVKYPSSSNKILPAGEYSTTFSGIAIVAPKENVAAIRITVKNDGRTWTETRSL